MTPEPSSHRPPEKAGGKYWKYLVEVRCPVSSCPQTLELGNLFHHTAGPPHWLPTHRYLGSPLTFTRSLPSPQLTSFEPIRFTFAQESFYLQTIASPDRRLLYHFVQVEGMEEDTRRFWVKISVSSLERSSQKGQATMTMRPTILDHHCTANFQAIDNALVMTER